MKIIHICSSYPYTSLYKKLLGELDNKNIEQIMYVPLASTELKNSKMLNNPKNTRFIYSKAFNKIDRYFYNQKLTKIYKDIRLKVELNRFDIIHAHFLFSNGGVAYRLKQELGIEYVVAVRNTDVNYFFKYGLHLRKFGIKILKEAKKVIFLSPEYKDYLFKEYVPAKLVNEICTKSIVIPNGIDEFWFDNLYQQKELNSFGVIKLIYVGKLDKNKNIYNSIKAALLLMKKGYSVKFDIIGDGPLKDKIKELIRKTNTQKDFILHGHINDKEKLMNLYRSADIFIMPSFTETFGLVYIEAMSQGLPVIYSKGQGIDGYFKDGTIGYHVLPSNVNDIASKVESIIKNYDIIYPNLFKVINDFKWGKIADKYIELY